MRGTVAMIGVVAVFAAGVALGSSMGSEPDGGAVRLDDEVELAGALTSFPACDRYLDHVRRHALEQVTPYGLGGGAGVPVTDELAGREESATAADGSGQTADADAAAPTAGTVPEDVSGTNVQEQGVDEPDRVKTDGDTLYVVAGEHLEIVDVRGDEPEQLGRLPLQEAGWGAELLLAGDRLLISSAGGAAVPFAGERRSGELLPGGAATTTLTAVDVSDPSAPEVVERLTLDGATLTMRMVEGVARVVIRTEPGTNLPWEHPEASGLRAERAALAANERLIEDSSADDWLPYYVHETVDGPDDEGVLVGCDQVAQPAEFAGLGLLSVLTIDVADGRLQPDPGAVGVLAGGDHVYASPERLYVATQRWPEDAPVQRDGPAGDAAVPGGGLPAPQPGSSVETAVHAFAIDDPRRSSYLGSGTVDGTLLSQWAMSEHDGVLRVASTVGDPWSAASSESSVTTLALDDDALVQLGRVDGLGPTETIRAVRFLGPVGYVVTFRQTDPLYTVDLSDPSDPAVVGELKIPGYSGYLHPVGDGRLIGVGQDADDQGVTRGAQVSLFDVSDPADPRRTDTVTVPDSQSPVEQDHRAFLHWPATGLTVVPVTRHLWVEPGQEREPAAGPASGALALVPEQGELRAAGDHAADELALHHADPPAPDAGPDELAEAIDRGHTGAITRSVVMGDRLLTISERGVVVHDLATLADRGALAF